MKTLLALTGVVALIPLLVFLDSKRRARRIESAFAGREMLSDSDFYSHYFSEKGVSRTVVIGVREILQEQLGADLSRLSAEDDFSRNLSFFWDYDSLADVEIVCALEERFGIKVSDEEAQSARTVSDIVNLVTRKLAAEDAV